MNISSMFQPVNLRRSLLSTSKVRLQISRSFCLSLFYPGINTMSSLLLLAVAFMAWTSSAATCSSIPPVPAPTNPADNPLAPPPPSKDPWYTAPSGYEAAAPGDILRTRSAPGLAQAVANSSAAYNILFRTTDGNYQPSWAVTTLYVPKSLGASNSSNSSAACASNSVLYSILLACK